MGGVVAGGVQQYSWRTGTGREVWVRYIRERWTRGACRGVLRLLRCMLLRVYSPKASLVYFINYYGSSIVVVVVVVVGVGVQSTNQVSAYGRSPLSQGKWRSDRDAAWPTRRCNRGVTDAPASQVAAVDFTSGRPATLRLPPLCRPEDICGVKSTAATGGMRISISK